MKKLRFFDSLKFVLATVACVFAIMPAHAATLPAGYTELEYIGTNHDAYIMTNFTVSDFDRVTAKIKLYDNATEIGNNSYPHLFGVSANDTSGGVQAKVFRFYNPTPQGMFAAYNNSWANNWHGTYQQQTVPFDVWHDFDIKLADGEQYIKMDNDVVATGVLNGTFTNLYKLPIFAMNYAGNIRYKPHLDSQEIKFYLGNTLVGDFIPTQRNSDGVIGMYDTVSGQFFTNAGTGEFVAGEYQIKIATTHYNETKFAPVETRLDAAVAAVDTVVTQTMTQAQAIDSIATSKQTRPDEGCTAKYCLLVEDEDGTPHWYPIAGANGVAHNLPTGYTELQYIESTGTQYINTGYIPNSNTRWELDNEYTETPPVNHFFNGVYQAGSGQPARFDMALAETGLILNYGATNNVNSNVSSFINTRYMYVVDAKNNKWAYNDTTGSFPSYSNMTTITKPLYLFARNDNRGVDRFAKQRTYSSKIYDDGILVQNLVPAKNSSGVVGMYDLVSGQFFTNQGTDTFIAGPDM